MGGVTLSKLQIIALSFLLNSSVIMAKTSNHTFLNWVDQFNSTQVHATLDDTSKVLLSLEGLTNVQRQKILKKFWQNTSAYQYDDPMMSHLLSESLDVFNKTDPIKSYILSKIDFKNLNTSCKADELIVNYSGLKSQSNYSIDLLHLRKLKQKHHKRKFALKMIENYKSSKMSLLTKDLWGQVKDDEVLLRKKPWLLKGQEVNEFKELRVSVQSQLSKRLCQQAEKTIKRSLLKSGDVEQWVDLGNKVYKCIKRQGRKKVLQFFDRYANILYEKKSFEGWSAAKLRKAKYLWGAGDFSGAKNQINGVIEITKNKKLKHSLGDARLLLGEIVQNEGDNRKSIYILNNFLKNHSDHADYSKALMKLTILEGSRRHWSRVKKIAEELEVLGKNLSRSKHDPAELAFGQFWQSVAKHKLKDDKGAIKIWKKLARDSFSSYYGAVASYMLERYNISHTTPSKASQSKFFEDEKYFNTFSDANQKTLKYVHKLIQLGLHQSASCELNHMDIQNFDDTQKMYLSAMLYLSGDWLRMVINYNSIPRSVRQSFPVGVETMMFPKKFDAKISQYAAKLGLEEEFIMAIIRQESIFNPKAKSWAGARGLMQLMPKTARNEARKIKKNYLDPQEKAGLRGLKSSKDKLFDHNVNIALGVHHVKSLFDIYKSPLFVLTSYNASPSATKRWKKNITFDDKLLFIEKIPYKETRAYAKLVFRNYYYYKKLYKPNSKPKLLNKILAGSFQFIEKPKTVSF